MKVPVCLSLLLLAAPALAQAPAPEPQKPVCIRASDNNDYNARPIGLHEVLARNALGRDHRAVRLMTTCTHIDRTADIGLHSMTVCMGVGDIVVTSTPLGPRERCRVTAISQAPEDYAKAKYAYR
jgi:hypothetical protein